MAKKIELTLEQGKDLANIVAAYGKLYYEHARIKEAEGLPVPPPNAILGILDPPPSLREKSNTAIFKIVQSGNYSAPELARAVLAEVYDDIADFVNTRPSHSVTRMDVVDRLYRAAYHKDD